MSEAKVTCRTPNPDKPGTTNIPQWKFDAVRNAILDILAEDTLEFRALSDRVRGALPEDILAKLGSVGWHSTVMKLEMEVRGEIHRLKQPGPQVIALSKAH